YRAAADFVFQHGVAVAEQRDIRNGATIIAAGNAATQPALPDGDAAAGISLHQRADYGVAGSGGARAVAGDQSRELFLLRIHGSARTALTVRRWRAEFCDFQREPAGAART